MSADEEWMSADAYGHSLKGMGVNLLVPEIEHSLEFQIEVLGAKVVYADEAFAVLESGGSQWMLHADFCYESHSLLGAVKEAAARGVGVELRVYDRDPDEAEAVARKLGYTVLEANADKPHGLREAYLVDSDGYVWVPSRGLTVTQLI